MVQTSVWFNLIQNLTKCELWTQSALLFLRFNNVQKKKWCHLWPLGYKNIFCHNLCKILSSGYEFLSCGPKCGQMCHSDLFTTKVPDLKSPDAFMHTDLFRAHFLCAHHHLLPTIPTPPSIPHLLKWLSKVPTSSPMRLSLAGTMPCRHTTRSLLSLVWNTTSWSFPGDTLTPVTWDGAREGKWHTINHKSTCSQRNTNMQTHWDDRDACRGDGTSLGLLHQTEIHSV